MDLPTTTVTLGDFVFEGAEIPERMPFGGDQGMGVIKLPGGRKIVQPMGADHAPIEWSGIFIGSTALSRARYLDFLRIQGKALTLSWFEMRYTVVIRSFRPVTELINRIPYSIVCEVVSLDSLPVTQAVAVSVDQAVAQDLAEVKTLSAQIADTPVSAAVAELDSAIKSVSTLANATQATISAVLTPVQAIQSRVQILMASAGNTLNSVATLGGIVPNSPAAAQARQLTTQLAAMTQTPALLQLQAVTGRLYTNVGKASASQPVAVAGANLYKMAADSYGDASEWVTIAQANGLTDPMYQGVGVIDVPAQAAGKGGVFNV